MGTVNGPTEFLPKSFGEMTNHGEPRDCVSIPTAALVYGIAARTYAMWLKVAGTDYESGFWHTGDGSEGGRFNLTYNNSASGTDVIRLIVGTAYRDANPTLSTGWRHIAVVVPGGSGDLDDIELYVDGVLSPWTGGSGTTFSTVSTTPQVFGAARTTLNAGIDVTAPLYGYICGVATFGRALSAAEIGTLITGIDSGGGEGSATRHRRPLGLGGNLGVRR